MILLSLESAWPFQSYVSKCEHNHFNFSNFQFFLHLLCLTSSGHPSPSLAVCWLDLAGPGWTWLIPSAQKFVSIIEYISTERRMRQKCHARFRLQITGSFNKVQFFYQSLNVLKIVYENVYENVRRNVYEHVKVTLHHTYIVLRMRR